MSEPIQNDINQATQFPQPQQGDASMEQRPVQQGDASMEAQPRPGVPAAPDANALPARTMPQQGATPDVRGLKKGVFDRVLQAAGGGPTFTFDSTTGERKELPMTKKSLAAHILAGAITGIISHAQGEEQVGPAGTRTPGNMAALAGGFQNTQQKMQDIRNKPQQMLDEQQLRKANAMQNTLAELRNQTAIHELHRGMDEDKEGYYKESKDVFGPIMDNFEKADQDSGGKLLDPTLRNLTPEDVTAKMKGGHGDLQPVQDGWVTKTDPTTGRTYHDPTYSLVRTGPMAVTPETLKTLSETNSAAKALLDRAPNASVSLSSTQVVSMEKAAHSAQVGYEFLSRMQESLGVDEKDRLTRAAFNEKFRNNPALQREAESIGNALGNVGTASADHALQQLQDSGKAPQFFKLLGKSPDEVQNYINEKQNEVATEKAMAKGASAIEIAKIKTMNKPLTDTSSASILADPNAAPADRARAQAYHNIRESWKNIDTQNKAEIDRSVKVGDPGIAARLLADGTLTLSQLKARSSDARFISTVTDMAQKIAQGNGEVSWTPQTGESEFKAAAAPRTRDFFGNVNSLIAPTGTLSQLQDQHAKLGNTPIPKFNTWKDALEYSTGDPALAGFVQTALAVADDYAKVMGGGIGTDSARLEILESFRNAHNPQQMQAAVNAARNGIKSQAKERIGHSRLLQQMYGDNVPENEPNTKPRPKSQAAPEGTIVNTPKGQMIKQGGQWVAYTGK